MTITQFCWLGNAEVNKIPNVILFSEQHDADENSDNPRSRTFKSDLIYFNTLKLRRWTNDKKTRFVKWIIIGEVIKRLLTEASSLMRFFMQPQSKKCEQLENVKTSGEKNEINPNLVINWVMKNAKLYELLQLIWFELHRWWLNLDFSGKIVLPLKLTTVKMYIVGMKVGLIIQHARKNWTALVDSDEVQQQTNKNMNQKRDTKLCFLFRGER